MELLREVLKIEVWGNTIQTYFIATFFFIGTLVVLRLIDRYIVKKLKSWLEKKSYPKFSIILTSLQEVITPFIYITAFYLATLQLHFSRRFERVIHFVVVVVLIVQLTKLLLQVGLYFFERNWVQKRFQAGSAAIARSLVTIIKVVVWGLAFVFILDNLGFNISAVVAGLGITGIAVALAAQTFLGDLFNYFVIFFDKPFEMGDFIIAGDVMGSIENVGVKTTRIRSLEGEEIIFPNSQLASSKIRNYKRMQQRRIQFKIGLAYETTSRQLEKIPQMIQKIIESIPETRFDRAHFQGYGDFSLNIEVVYFVLNADYNRYMDIQQRINLEIKKMMEEEKVIFAYTTQRLLLKSAFLEIEKPASSNELN